MGKISLYIFLIIIYLGMSRTFSPEMQAQIYIKNEKSYSKVFQEQPLSLILVDSFKTGFIIKSYFQKYLKVYAFGPTEEILVKTSKDFWKKNFRNRGMSLFRRSDNNKLENSTPLPPGIIFMNNPSFGSWRPLPSGDFGWFFHRAYKNFPKSLGWGKFIMTRSIYLEALNYEKKETPYYGPHREFGEHGVITEKSFPRSNLDKRKQVDFWEHLKDILGIKGTSIHE
jgi:hypothetical protein